jgi:hypothetical protein
MTAVTMCLLSPTLRALHGHPAPKTLCSSVPLRGSV